MAANRGAGIDVSHYKSRIDWAKVKAHGVQFAFIKATEAEHFVDPRFDFNWTRTRRVGLIRGAYHFFRPLADPVSQANHFIKIAGRTLHTTDLPPVLDIEMYPDFMKAEWKRISLEERMRRIQFWLDTVEKATGRTPMIYTNYYTWYDLLDNTTRFTRYPLWIATYKAEQPKVPADNWGGKGWWFWQTTDRGVIPGIREEAPCVDLNLFAGSYEDMKRWLKIEGPRSVPPQVTNGNMMAALVDTADTLGVSSDELVRRTGLRYLVEPIGNSMRPYDGPAVSELTLSGNERETLEAALENYIGVSSSAWSITHQDLINAFFYAASMGGDGGWTLVERAGIDYIGEDRDAIYTGPVIDELDSLTETQRDAISTALGLLEDTVVEEPVVVALPPEEAEEEMPEEAETAEEAVPAGPPEPQATYGPEVDNQAVINAFYLTAIRLESNGREMMAAAGLSALVNDRLAVYTGPRVEEMTGLTTEQRSSIAGLMGVDLGDLVVDELVEAPEPVEETEEAELPAEEPASATAEPVVEVEPNEEELTAPVEVGQPEESVKPEPEPEPVRPELPLNEEPTYPGLVNQDLINLFLRVAAFVGESGWNWLVQTGLEIIGLDRRSRFEPYHGPKIADLDFLTAEQRAALEDELAQLT